MTRRLPSHWAAALLTCALLAVAHTWPLVTAPHRLSGHDNADVMLNEWILAWVQRQLPRDPLHLFEANIFHPAHDTLAFSEPLIVPALIGAPIRWLGGSPVLVHNLLVMAGLALTALAAYAAAYAWTADRLASLVAASAFAFNTHFLMRLAHMQALHAYGLPLALLATDRLLVTHRTRDAFWLAAWMTITAYTSGYLLVFATVMVGIAILARPGDWARDAWRVLPRFALAAGLAGLAIVPLYMPYRRVAAEQGLVRTLGQVSDFSASLKGYVVSAGRLHGAVWSQNLARGEIDAFFPGIAVLLLSLAAVLLLWRSASVRGGPRDARTPPMGRRDGSLMPDPGLTRRRAAMLLAIAGAGLVLSLGTNTPIYGWLYAVFPPLGSIRVAARFNTLFLLALALLAGIGAARLRTSGMYGGRGAAATLGLVALVNIEALRAPIAYPPFEGIPNLYAMLGREPGPVVLVEQPFYPAQGIFQNAEYVLNSTMHWRPLMNGYSGFIPASYRKHAETFWFFPRAHAIQAMRDAGVTHVMVHPRRFGRDAPEVQRTVASSPYLERIAVGHHDVTLYRLR